MEELLANFPPLRVAREASRPVITDDVYEEIMEYPFDDDSHAATQRLENQLFGTEGAVENEESGSEMDESLGR